ncbi:MAG: hypothetical protein ACF8XB_17505 [Planctomycetota bacterium JB042]
MIRLRSSSALCLFALVAPAPVAVAQLPLTLASKFVDNQAGGNGNIGVTQDEIAGNFYVIDFSNTNTVHEFDSTGTFLTEFPTSGCSPSAPSPNDIVWDPSSDSLWIVDNNNDVVLEISRTGACIGGFSLPSLGNPTGITIDRATQTLYVSDTSQVVEVDKTGNVLGGGFPFTPPSGSTFLSGITFVPSLGNFLITQSSGSSIFEVSPTGTLVSTTDLTSFGVGNTQGIHFNHAQGTLLVVDNTLSTTFIFDGLGCALPYGDGCVGSGGFVPSLEVAGCADLGATISVSLSQALGGTTSALLVGLAPTAVPVGAGCDLLVAPPSFAITIPLGGSGPGAGAFTLPGVIPLTSPLVDVYLQTFVLDPGVPLGLSATNGVKMPITP